MHNQACPSLIWTWTHSLLYPDVYALSGHCSHCSVRAPVYTVRACVRSEPQHSTGSANFLSCRPCHPARRRPYPCGVLHAAASSSSAATTRRRCSCAARMRCGMRRCNPVVTWRCRCGLPRHDAIRMQGPSPSLHAASTPPKCTHPEVRATLPAGTVVFCLVSKVVSAPASVVCTP